MMMMRLVEKMVVEVVDDFSKPKLRLHQHDRRVEGG